MTTLAFLHKFNEIKPNLVQKITMLIAALTEMEQNKFLDDIKLRDLLWEVRRQGNSGKFRSTKTVRDKTMKFIAITQILDFFLGTS